jgi:tetratricopeptide (TPR) repeat protein
MRRPFAILFFSLLLQAQTPYDRAAAQFASTGYDAALKTLQSAGLKTAFDFELAGRCRFHQGDFKQAVEHFEKAVAADPKRSLSVLWLGRAWGRRAETSNPLMAPVYASRARQNFEKAVQLDPRNYEAVNDLFSYYVDAPGIMGGGLDKAEKLLEPIRAHDPAEYHYALAVLAERRRLWDAAESQWRKAAELAPRQAGRLVDLARFLARRNKWPESEKVFARAEQINPSSPALIYSRAEAYVEARRNLETARALLEMYLTLPLTPDDPSRDEARRLLRRATGG